MNKKIALCFLTYENLSQPNLWENFLTSDYNVYIHNKHDFKGFFKKYCIKNKEKTNYGDITLVKAMLRVLQEAYNNIENKYFITLSDKCIPLYTGTEIYNKITTIDNNLIDSFKPKKNKQWYHRRYNNIEKDFFNKNNFYGSESWMVLTRYTVKFLLNNNFTNKFSNKVHHPAETYFINIINKHYLKWKKKQLTYTNWKEKSDDKKYQRTSSPKTYSLLTNEIVLNIINSNKKPFFMRKVCSECKLPTYFNRIIKKKPYLIVGCGLSGCVIARELAENNISSLIIEKRDHIGGNCYDYVDKETNILVNKYGSHYFHTNNEEVWNYINKYGEWERYENNVLGYIDNKYVPIPVNISTVNKLCNENIQTEKDMDEWLKKNQIKYDEIKNGEEMVKSRVGEVLYDKVFKNYRP